VRLFPSTIKIGKSSLMKTNENVHKLGFTLIEIVIVVSIIGLLAAILIPNILKARGQAQTNTCINNLRIIDGAKKQWSLEKGQPLTIIPVSSEIAPYINRASTVMPSCPLSPNGIPPYNINAVSDIPTCPNSNATHQAVLSE
jgi:prepilin-type N-terminal cleavage/methylation domain-containing protein